MDTLLIPEGNLGHPVAYTLNLTHKHTHTNHSRKIIHIGKNMFTGSGVYTDIIQILHCVCVCMCVCMCVCVCVCACVCACVCVKESNFSKPPEVHGTWLYSSR